MDNTLESELRLRAARSVHQHNRIVVIVGGHIWSAPVLDGRCPNGSVASLGLRFRDVVGFARFEAMSARIEQFQREGQMRIGAVKGADHFAFANREYVQILFGTDGFWMDQHKMA